MRLRPRYSIFLILFFFQANLYGVEIPKVEFEVTKYQLPNGLKVILHQDNNLPIISYHTWFLVGSRNEGSDKGLAHMLEHMMFKGTKKFPTNSYDKILHENGITNNAFTTFDYTGYYQNLPSSKLELMMQLESDRMTNLVLRDEDLKIEREVVKEERRWRIDNNPLSLLGELIYETIFKKHPYRYPVIGSMKDITGFSVDALRKFYNDYYVPNNAVLVLAGDFRIQDVKSLVEKYYGSIPQKSLPDLLIQKEEKQIVQYNAKLKKDVKAISFDLVFQSVNVNHSDLYALDLICTLLGDGNSSRLYNRLVSGKQLATSVGCYHSNMIDHGVFDIHVDLKPEIKLDDALNIVYNEVYMFRNFLIKETELEKGKILTIKQQIDNLQTLDQKAHALAFSDLISGSYTNVFAEMEKIQKVRIEDIKRVASEYLNQTQRSIVSLEPK